MDLANYDWQGLFQNPLFIAGIAGLSGPKGQEGKNTIAGLMQGQQMQGQRQLQQLNALKLQQMQAQQAFNPQDFMQTTPVQGTSLASALSGGQPAAMPATLGGPTQGGITQMAPQQDMQQPLTPQPGTPTGRVDMQGLLAGGLQAGMSPAEVQQIAGIMDPQTAAQMALATKTIDVAPGGKVLNGLGQTIGENTNPPVTGESAELGRLIASRDAAIARGDKGNASVFQSAIDKLNGAAQSDYHNKTLGLHQQMVDIADKRLNGDPVQIEQTAQAIADGKLAPLSGFAMKTPQGQAVMNRVMELNPQYSAQDYAAGQQTLTAFSRGKQSDITRSLNVAIDHLGTMGELVTALKNGDIQTANKLGNTVATLIGKPAPTNFDAAKSIVGDEIVKAIVGAGGGVSDRKDAQASIDSAKSPEQLQGVIQTYQKLLAGQLGGLQRQYEQGTKRKDFDRFLSPATKNLMSGGKALSVVRTGTQNGRKVVQYSDGSVAYAD
jgi:hypothetical protein